MDKYIKWVGAALALAAIVGNYYVLHYRVNELTGDVGANQEVLSTIVVDIAVIKTQVED